MKRFASMTGAMMITLSMTNISQAYTPPVPPGEHPRVLFTQKDLPNIRKRLDTKLGKSMLAELKQQERQLASMLSKKDEKSQTQLRRDVVNKFSKIPKMVRTTALLYILTGDKKYGKTAKDAFVLWIDTLLNKGLKPKDNWGEPEYAMTYDWIFDLLTPEEKEKARKVFQNTLNDNVEKMFDEVWWLAGPSPTLRNSINWTPICTSGLALTFMATEGEVECPDSLKEKTIKHMRNNLNHGIAVDGAMYEGLTYPTGYGTDRLPYMLIALKLRGIDLINTTNIGKVPYWFAYEMLPWGGEGQAMNKGDGNFNSGTFTTFLASEFGGLADWIHYQAAGREPGVVRMDPTAAFVNGVPKGNAAPPAHLPNSHFFSTNGKVICRSGWGPRDAHFVFSINPLGAGHSHADQGTFCYADDGVNFVADSSTTVYASEEHNIILIDGKGQPQLESAAEAYIRSADFSNCADVIDTDLKLAYDRVLAGRLNGPWNWTQFNPVQQADRRSMFVKGVTGPILIIADEIKKDDKPHEYEWLLHSVINNKISTSGRRFTITERFGGVFLESLGDGLTSTLVGQNPQKDAFHGWVLVRGIPYSRWWSNTTVKINGKAMPYNTTYFQLGQHGLGWHWVPLLPKGPKKSPVIELPAGKVDVELLSKTGAQVAMAVFTKQYDWKPGFDIPENSDQFIVLKANDAKHAKKHWKTLEDPLTELQGIFLGENPPELKVSKSKATNQPVLKAIMNIDKAKFLCVMAAIGENRKREMLMPLNGNGQEVVLRSEQGVDIISGAVDHTPTTGHLKTDAVAAVATIPTGTDQIKAYAATNGLSTSYKEHKLVAFDKSPGTVVNDGETIIIRGEGASRVTCAKLEAKKLIVNGQSTAMPKAKNGMITLSLPKLSEEWKIKISPDGEFVEVTGDGPLPLVISGAPDAIDVKVNGVSLWFVKTPNGDLYPSLSCGTQCFSYKHELSPAQIAAAGGLELKTIPSLKIKAIEATPRTEFKLPFPAPAIYNITVNLIPTKSGKTSLWLDESPKTLEIAPTQVNKTTTVNFSDLKVTGKIAKLKIDAPAPVWLSKIILNPTLELIPAEKWRIIGPFTSEWGRSDDGEEPIKTALSTIHEPEKEIDFTKTYIGDLGQKVTWSDCKPEEIVKFDLDKGVAFRQIGVKPEKNTDNRAYTGRICYAVTFIKSPSQRKAILGISCDWWANAFLNGQKVISERPDHLKSKDGAEFNTDGVLEAEITLKKGKNILLIKCHGGTGGNRFVASITNPGDLEFTNQ